MSRVTKGDERSELALDKGFHWCYPEKPKPTKSKTPTDTEALHRMKARERGNGAAEIARFSPEEAEQYEESLKIYRDLKNSLDTAREEGREEGMEKGKFEIALKMIAKGKSFEEINEITELSIQQIKQLAEENKVTEPSGKYKAKRKPAKPRKK